MCIFKPPKAKLPKQSSDQSQSYAMRALEASRAGMGSSQATNPTGALGVPAASAASRFLTA